MPNGFLVIQMNTFTKNPKKNNLKTITVVGAGTAGALAACFLKKHFPTDQIILLHSDHIPTIGVGESVTPHVKGFLNEIGVDEKDMMLATQSIFKYANCFKDWINEKEDVYFAFNYNEPLEKIFNNQPITKEDIVSIGPTDMRATDVWIDLFNNKKVQNYSDSFVPLYSFMNKNKAPFDSNGCYLGSENFSYAYHIDAEKLAPYLIEKHAKPSGVKEIIDTITKVNCDQQGIASVELQSGAIISSDIWIDATGFHRTLISKLTNDYHAYTHCPANSAWVSPLKYSDADQECKNHTQSIWHSMGWVFKIGLLNRMGCGLVYNDKYFTDAQAKEEFLKIIDKKNLKEPRLIKWEPKRFKTPAIKNVCAVGMAAGFIEPMEANALFISVSTIFAATMAIKNNNDWTDYNEKVCYALDDIADFISVHYTLCSKKTNKFWQDMYDLGIELNHKQLLKEKYNSEKNTVSRSYNFLTIFPDYMWAELASVWLDNLHNWSKNSPEHLQNKLHDYLTKKQIWADGISNQTEEYYQFISKLHNK